MKKISITVLSDNALRKAEAEANAGRNVYAEPSGRGYRVFGIEPNLVELAKRQGAIGDKTLVVEFTE